MTPDEYCQQKAAASGSSFYYSFLFLSPKRRRAITALYAFCREVDDVVDETSDPQVASARLTGCCALPAARLAISARHHASLAPATCGSGVSSTTSSTSRQKAYSAVMARRRFGERNRNE